MIHTVRFLKFTMVLIVVLSVAFLSATSVNAKKSEQERIAEINKIIAEGGYHFIAGKTSVSDLTDEQILKRLGLVIPPRSELEKHAVPKMSAPADATYDPVWDWRQMGGTTPAKDQDDCGSCWAFAAVGQLESHVKIYDGRIEDLSEQQMLSCNDYGSYCEGGTWYYAYELFQDPGAVTEECMPYVAPDWVECTQDECLIHGRISGYSLVSEYGNDIDTIKEALLTGPVWAGIYVSGPDSPFICYAGGCYDYNETGFFGPNHAVLIVGWDDTQCGGVGAWTIKNSWGENWGESGYGYVQYGVSQIGWYSHQIDYIPEPLPSLTVLEPNGGEAWLVGTERTIRWINTNKYVHHFQVGYYAGATYHLIDDNVDPGVVHNEIGELPWTVPNDPYGECIMQVGSLTANNDVIDCDLGDGSFAILAPRTEWDQNGVPVCTAVGSQFLYTVISDGAKGAILSWYDDRSTNGQIYAQKIDFNGDPLWADNPITVHTEAEGVNGRCMVPDGSGGAILTWYDDREGNDNIYAQRIGSNADVLWAPEGIAVCASSGAQQYPVIASDGAGGAVVAWGNGLYYEQTEIFAQRINGNGEGLWDENGILVSSGMTQVFDLRIVSDGAGGAFLTWLENRGTESALRVQRVNNNAALWGTEGIALYSGGYFPGTPELIHDGSGRLIVTWSLTDPSDVYTENIYAQKLDADGTLLWGANGVDVCTKTGDQFCPELTTDGSGGAIITWLDRETRNYPDYTYDADIYAQRVDANGIVQWDLNGIEINVDRITASDYSSPTLSITYDGEGGAFIVWRDSRDGSYNSVTHQIDNWDIYAQRVNSSGAVQWYQNGEPVCVRPSDQYLQYTNVYHDGSIIVAWSDDAGDNPFDVYAQKIEGNYSPVPRCAVTAEILRGGNSYQPSETFLFGCPAGDRGDALKITCDFYDEDVSGIGEIAPTDIILDTADLPYSFCDPSFLGSPGTARNGYVVIMVREHICGCSGCEGGGCYGETGLVPALPVLYEGFEIGAIQGLEVKSIDATGDGVVNISELSYMGQTYNKPPDDPAFNSCYDFNGDGYVNVSDFSFLGGHYQHSCPSPSGSPALVKAPTSDVGVKFVVDKSDETFSFGTVRVTVYIKNANRISTMCFGLRNEEPSLKYGGWTPHTDLEADVTVLPVSSERGDQLFLAGFHMESVSGDLVEIGTLEYSVSNDNASAQGAATPELDEKDLVLVFGDILDPDGNLERMTGTEYEEVLPVYRDHLANNYPNPFNPTTTIEYSIKEQGHVALRIYNVAGQLIKTLVDEVQDPTIGIYEVQWDGRSNAGTPVSSGVYFYRIVSGEYSQTKKMVLLK